MRFLPRPLVVVSLAWLTLSPRPDGAAADVPDPGASTLITHAVVVDGTGAPRRKASVRILGDRIAEIGALRPRPGEQVLDAGGRALVPGFIDTHSHADDGIFEHPDALAAVSQGITTVIVGQSSGVTTRRTI